MICLGKLLDQTFINLGGKLHYYVIYISAANEHQEIIKCIEECIKLCAQSPWLL